MKKILIFGATGSIGLQTIEIIKNCPNNFKLVGFSFFNNEKVAKKISCDFKDLKIYSKNKKILNNVSSYKSLIELSKPDLIVNSIIGFAGIEISLLSVKYKINLALANKETIIAGGDLFLEDALRIIKIFPIDSEHTALYELVNQVGLENIKKLFITASGGKYYNLDDSLIINEDFNKVVKHPIWNMGKRISLDSSNMINKFFEIVEAYYYFKKNISALYHPTAVIHAGVQKKDNGYFFHFSVPDMKYSIGQALNEFKNHSSLVNELDFSKMNFTLEKIDPNKWVAIKWANDFIKHKYYALPIIVNAIDEELIKIFKKGKINYSQITKIIDIYVQKYKKTSIDSIDKVITFDRYMRQLIKKEFFYE